MLGTLSLQEEIYYSTHVLQFHVDIKSPRSMLVTFHTSCMTSIHKLCFN